MTNFNNDSFLLHTHEVLVRGTDIVKFAAHTTAFFIDIVVAIFAMYFSVIMKTALKPAIAIVARVWVARVTGVFHTMSIIVEYVIA
jgi:hypothetical protein